MRLTEVALGTELPLLSSHSVPRLRKISGANSSVSPQRERVEHGAIKPSKVKAFSSSQ